MSKVIGIDLGGTKIEVLLLDDRDRILYRRRIATPRESRNTYEVILSSVCALVRNTLERVPAEMSVTVGIGITIAIMAAVCSGGCG